MIERPGDDQVDSPLRSAAPHQKMEPFAGTFRSEVKMWMAANAEPMISTGLLNSSWQVDGLFLQQDYIGDPVPGATHPFQGRGFWGYNVSQGHYEGFWIDNASTEMQMESGDVNESGTVWEMKSQMVSPQTGEVLQKRSLNTLLDEDRHRVEMFFAATDGKQVKAMEINYTRTTRSA